MLGGDTDTNCAIVGGLIGCAVGLHDIPSEMWQKVLNCPYNKKPRPEFLRTNYSMQIIKALLKIAPTELEVIVSGGPLVSKIYIK